jgi:hypothetical protein
MILNALREEEILVKDSESLDRLGQAVRANKNHIQVHIGHISGRNELPRWLALRRIDAEICSQSPIASCMDSGRGRNGSTPDLGR